ncbi:MAG: hypothetical protein AABX98_03335 [Nanoarchaeota archaeon]
MQNKKAQFSLEYMFIVAFAMSAVLITATVFFMQSRESGEQQQLTNIEIIANDILSTAKSVYYAGGISKKTVRYTMPTIVNNISVSDDNALVFSITSEGITSDLVYYSDVPIEGVFPHDKGYTEQITHILIYNRDDYVLICTEEFGC